MKKVLILGAGISGLSYGYYLQKRFPDVEITFLEKKERVGGWMETRDLGGQLFEMGPRFFKGTKSLDILELLKEIDLEKEIIDVPKKFQGRYIYQKGKLEKLPQNLFSFLTSPLTRGLILPLLKECFRKRGDADDETVSAFIKRRFRSEKIAVLFDTFAKGIYAGDIDKLSLKHCFPALYEMERKKGSIVRGLFAPSKEKKLYEKFTHVGIFTLQKGIGSIPLKLSEKIRANFVFDCAVTKIGQKEVETTAGTFAADHIACALPFIEAQKLLPLESIPYHNFHLVNFGFTKKVIRKDAFGYLIPTSENEKVMGCVFDSDVNADVKGSRLGFFLGGAHHPEVDRYSDEECIDLAGDALRRHLAIAEKPLHVNVTRAFGVGVSYEVGFEKKREIMEAHLAEKYPHLTLLGNYLDGVAVNHCILRSKRKALEAVFVK